jgi:hypothetical protein
MRGLSRVLYIGRVEFTSGGGHAAGSSPVAASMTRESVGANDSRSVPARRNDSCSMPPGARLGQPLDAVQYGELWTAIR